MASHRWTPFSVKLNLEQPKSNSKPEAANKGRMTTTYWLDILLVQIVLRLVVQETTAMAVYLLDMPRDGKMSWRCSKN